MHRLFILVHEKILESKHVNDGKELSLNQIVQSPAATEPVTKLLSLLISDSGTVVARGFQQLVHKDMLECKMKQRMEEDLRIRL